MNDTRSRLPPEPERTWLRDDETGEDTDEVQVAGADPLSTYADLGRIGGGERSEVHRVRDSEFGRVLAMKILRPPYANRSEAVAAFLEEARITAAMAHPGVIPVHGIGRLPDGRPFFTMKEVRGRSLGSVLRARARGAADPAWSERRILEAFQQICVTIAAAHARGVIHRDLQPENVLLGQYGEVLVVEWGLARALGGGGVWDDEDTETFDPGDDEELRETAQTAVAGPPLYMSPEQASGEVHSLGFPSDVYALGAMLYEIVRGHPPTQDPAPATNGIAGTPLGIAIHALATDAANRPEDAGKMAQALRHWLDGGRDRELAAEEVDRARQALPGVVALRAEAAASRKRAAALLESTPADAPIEEKRFGWALEDQAESQEQQAEVAEAEALQRLRGALLRAPDLEVAHETLASWYQVRHADAEARADRPTAARLEALLRTHDRGAHRAYLRAEGALTLVTDPPGAEARLFRYERRDRQLIAVPWGEPLKTPIQEVALPIGSWRVDVTARKRPTVRYPFAITRMGHWDGIPPGDTVPHAIVLPESLAPDECYVPAGWASIGGDPAALMAWPEHRVWVKGFVIRRFPVSLSAWVAFLRDTPEASAFGAFGSSAPDPNDSVTWRRGPDGWVAPPDGDRWPATFLNWHAASAFAAWEAARTGRAWRLPVELEFEKAARGADGRHFPWGDWLDPTFCAHAGAFHGHPHMTPMDAYPIDESPYGVRGLAGGVRTWVLDPFDAHRPALESLVAQTSFDFSDTPAEAALPRCERGGAWKLGGHFSRSAGRWWQSLDYRDTRLGLRLARRFG